jgi:uncharacterized damage-inducible protein DinB
MSAVKTFDEVQHAKERHNAIRILNHTYVVDRIFAANLQRLPHEYTATNTTETPTLDQLSTAIHESDQWYVGYVSKLSAEAMSESIDFTFSDGTLGRMSREEMLSHVATHGGYHRGQVGWITNLLSIKPPRDVFTGYLHKFEPASRRR